MNIWVPGAAGMLGRAVTAEVQRAGHIAIATVHDDCSIDEPEDVKNILAEYSPDVVINCAGVTKSKEVHDMVQSNSLGPWVLAKLLRNRVRLIHVSTDCVFSGNGEGSHNVADLPDPKDPYGRTKLAGEPSEPHVLVVRTSFVGAFGGLGKWLLSKDGEAVDGWERYLWNGSSVQAVALALVQEATIGKLSGVHHAASSETVSKFWLLRKMAEVWKLDVHVRPVDAPVVNRVLQPTIELPSLAWALGRMAHDD